jgi:hypothetical protein
MKASIIHTQRFLAGMAAASLAATVLVSPVTTPPSRGSREAGLEPQGKTPTASRPGMP